MTKYPIGIQDFEKIRKEDYLYVDKTTLIYRLVTEGAVYFLSRPRRFGKSLLVSTLKNYFLGRKELFKGLAIDSLEKKWAEHPVFHIDFNGTDFTVPGTLEQRLDDYIAEWEELYGRSPIRRDRGGRFSYVLQQAHQRYNRRCVVLIDEYDKPILDVLDTNIKTYVGEQEWLLEDRNRETLKAFYSVFKAADGDLQFVLLTGVTKFYPILQDFNQAIDISLDKRFETLCGITQIEIERYFQNAIQEMAIKLNTSQDNIMSRLKEWYNGYHFSSQLTDIYAPSSLLKAFANQTIDIQHSLHVSSYLTSLFAHKHRELKELAGRYYGSQDFIENIKATKSLLANLYQHGYFAIKDSKPQFDLYLLDIANKEAEKTLDAIKNSASFSSQTGTIDDWKLESRPNA